MTPCTEAKAAEEGLWELHKVYVKTGIFDDAYIEITEGLSAGDFICPSVSQGLEDGAQVQAIPTGAAAAALQAAQQPAEGEQQTESGEA